MSDPMTNAEVEDILSSIRRLVSEESRTDPVTPDPKARPANRLVLTPALRVESPPVETQTDNFELLKPDTSEAFDSVQDFASEAETEVEAQADVVSESDTEVFAQEPEAAAVDCAPFESARAGEDASETPEVAFAEPVAESPSNLQPEKPEEPEHLFESGSNDLAVSESTDVLDEPEDAPQTGAKAQEDNSIGWSMFAAANARYTQARPGVSPDLFRTPVPDAPVEVEVEAGEDDATELADSVEEIAGVAPEEYQVESVPLVAEDDEGADEDDRWVTSSDHDALPDQPEAEDAWLAEAESESASEDAEDDDLNDDLNDDIAAAPFVHVALTDEEEFEAAQKETAEVFQLSEAPRSVPSLSDKIAALESLVERDRDEFEPDQADESDIAAAAEPAVEWDEVEASLEEDVLLEDAGTQDDEILEDAEADALLKDAYYVPTTEDQTETPIAFAEGLAVEEGGELGPLEDGVLDEDTLREIVSDIVREELQGALGERITRNVRKLVRREIHRALAAQDLD